MPTMNDQKLRNKPEKYAIYLRKSRADLDAEALGQGETLARHRRQLLELAGRCGYAIGEVYQEIRSGDSVEARPEMLRLLSDVECRRWAGVLCMDIDRLARGDSADQGRIIRTFCLSDTLIVTPNRVYDMSDDDDEDYADFGLFMARKEYKAIRRRMLRGRIASAQEGHFIGSTPPFGYDKVRLENGRGWTLAPNQESEAVRLMYSMCVSGEGCTMIAERLDELGVFPRSGGRWSRASVADILKNPVYCGKIRWRYRRERKSSSGGRITKQRSVSGEHILVQGLHSPLVSEEVFRQAQECMTGRKRTSANSGKALRNPLAGLVVCGKCGALMQRVRDRRTVRLACLTPGCGNISAELSLVESAVASGLSGWFGVSVTPEFPHALELCPDVNCTEILRAGTDRLMKQRERVYTLFEQGIYSDIEFRERLSSISSQLEKIEKAESAQEQPRVPCECPAESEHSQPATVLEIYQRASPEQKNALLKSVVDRVTYTKEKRRSKGAAGFVFHLEIAVKFPPE